MAIGGLRALMDAGVDVPRQTSVIGFNGTALRHAIQTRLTTIEVPLAEVGTRAALALLVEGSEKTDIVPFRILMGNTVRP
jgi:LacI family gluconate utilization system Gnt-I transcriptional repressor